MRPQPILTSQSFLPVQQQQQPAQSYRLSSLQKKYDWLPYIYATIANISLVFLQINLKILSSYISPLHALGIRGFFLLVINSIIITYNKQTLNIKDRETFKLLLKRIILSCATVSMFLGSVKYIPLGTANALFNVGPVVVCFIEAWRYKKKLNKVHFILTSICFIGILMVIQPDFIFGYNDTNYISNISKIFMVLCLISAFTNAFSMLILHDLKGKVNATIALQYFYIGQALFNSLAMTFQQNNFDQIQVDLTFFLSIVGLVFFAYTTQNLTTRAMLLKKPSYIMPFGYITLIVSALMDKIIFGSQFGLLMIVGMFLTSSGLLVKVLVPQQDGEKKIQIKNTK